MNRPLCSCFSRPWGLYDTSNNTIPLKSLNIHVSIINNIARVLYTQTYRHTSQLRLETEFLFPISPDDCFDSFEAKFNNTTIKGIVKEKEKAKEEYKSGVQQGKTVAYSEITGESNDVMKVCIGNIPPNVDIEIKYSYIQKLETYSGKFWCFKLFSKVLSHRSSYDVLTEGLVQCVDSDMPFIYSNLNPESSTFLFSIKVEIQSPSPITMVKSPYYPINTLFGNENHTCSVVLSLDCDRRLTKDFVLVYSSTRESPVDYVMAPFEDGYCAMMTLLPDFQQEESPENAYEKYAKAKEPEPNYEMDSIRGEYIFLIDRSGSMLGERIDMARRSLLLFLKSLPKDSLFNVVSFGVGYKFLSNSSMKYSQEALMNTSREVDKFSANMGGTEIYTPLQRVFAAPQIKGYPRFVFLLTDGAVKNVNKVYQLIQENSDKAVVYTIGIGKECSPEFIANTATYGKGKYAIVSNNSDIMGKVIDLLDMSFSPSYSDFSFKTDNFDALVKGISPNINNVPFLLDSRPLIVFLFIRKEAFSDENSTMIFTWEMYDSQKKERRKVEIPLDVNQALENDMIPKLAIHSMIKSLETEKKSLGGDTQHNMVWRDEKEIKETLLEYSLKYGILCEETAFFCEIKSNNDDQINAMPQKKQVIPIFGSQSLFPVIKPPGSAFLPSKQPPTIPSHKPFLPQLAPPQNIAKSTGPTFPAIKQSQQSYQALNNTITPPPTMSFNPTINRYSGSTESPPKDIFKAPPKMMAMPMQAAPIGSMANKSMSFKQPNISPPGKSAWSDHTSADLSRPPLTYGSQMQAFTTGFNAQSKPPMTSTGFQQPGAPMGYALSSSSGQTSSDLSRPPLTFGSQMPSSNNANTFMSTLVEQTDMTYIDVIMKQNIEGYWDCDVELMRIIAKNREFPAMPNELKKMGISAEVWMTILILAWLEIACENGRKAWKLIHQKGCEWLKSQAVIYKDVKDFGIEVVKV